jgi:hypothetical protein
MLDFYAFPRDFPDYETLAKTKDSYQRVLSFEAAMKRHINNPRFIPNIQLHEFEALLLSKPDEIVRELPDIQGDEPLAKLVADIGSLKPEEINQTREGAPSKRLMRFFPAYRKRTMGPPIARRIGFPHLKTTCPHFGAWLSSLEALGTSSEPGQPRPV